MEEELAALALKGGDANYIKFIQLATSKIDANDTKLYNSTRSNAQGLWSTLRSKPKDESFKGGANGTGEANMPSGIADFMRKMVQTQYRNNVGMAPGEFQNVDKVANLLIGNDNKFKGIGQIFKDIAGNIGQQVILFYQQQNDLLQKINEKAGMLGDLSKGFRQEITLAAPQAVKLGISFEELSETIANVTATSGKFKMLDEKTIEDMALVSKFSDSLRDYGAMVPVFESVGLGVGDMNRELESAGKRSLGLGLNARTTVKTISENLGKLNEYGFKNGVAGMTTMAQKATEFRMSMDSAFKLADKVWSPEGALDVVANLQVIGGAFGDLNDPIKLMYMATNNVEGLQDALIGASKSLATYNQEQGRFEVTGANLRRAKEMADQFGMSMGDLTKGAVAAMERTQAASDLMSKGLNLKPEQTEFLTNLARMEGGKMVISIPENLREQFSLAGDQKNIALDTLSQAQADRLILEQDKLKDKSMTQIAQEQVSLIENINRDLSFVVATMRIQAGTTGNKLVAALGFDPVKMALEASNLANNVGKKIVNGNEYVQDQLQSLYAGTGAKVVTKNQRGNISNEATATPITTAKATGTETATPMTETAGVQKHEMSVTIKSSDNTVDAIKRSVFSDQRFQSDFERDFLAAFKPKK